MKFIVALLVSLVFSSCKVYKQSAIAKQGLPFNDIKFEILQGKINDSIINFSVVPDSAFSIRFYQRKFRYFDGSFNIAGAPSDTTSAYHKRVYYTGFYKIQENNVIQLYWFSNISWSFDFDKHPMGKIIAKLFAFNGKYYYNKDVLIFYKENAGQKDSVIIMKML